MSMFRPMRDELFKYRKRKRSTNGSVPGVPYTDYRKSRHYVSGLPFVPRGPGFHHDLYNWGNPSKYHPNWNAPSVDWTEYDPYEPLDFGHVPMHDNPRSPRGFKNSNLEIPKFPTSTDDLTLTEQFLMAMGKRSGSQEEPIELSPLSETDMDISINESDISADNVRHGLPKLEDLTDALVQLQQVLPDDHPDIIRLSTAIQALNYHQSMPQDPTDDNAYTVDPFKEAGQLFEQQMEFLEQSFEEPLSGPAEISAPEMSDQQAGEPEALFSGHNLDVSFSEQGNLEQVMEQENSFGAMSLDFMQAEMMPDESLPNEDFVEEQTLDDIIGQEDLFGTPAPEFIEPHAMPVDMADMSGPMPGPAGYDAGMIANEINQAMDEVTQAPMAQDEEMDPFQPLYAPYMMGQNMLGQPQYMADPFMIPEQCGPMGPMPGPMPGP